MKRSRSMRLISLLALALAALAGEKKDDKKKQDLPTPIIPDAIQAKVFRTALRAHIAQDSANQENQAAIAAQNEARSICGTWFSMTQAPDQTLICVKNPDPDPQKK